MNQQQKVTVQETEGEVEIDLLELLRFLKGRLWMLIIACVFGAVLFGAVTHYLITPKYQAACKVYMVSASSDSIVNLTDLNLGTSLSADYEELIKIRPLFTAVIDELGLDYTYEELLEMTSISVVNDTRILKILVTSTDPEEAKNVANALADKAVEVLPDLMETSEPNIAERAILPENPSSPNLMKNAVIGGLLFLLIAVAIYTVLYLSDDTLKTAEDVEKAFGVMPLSVIPEGDVEEISDQKEKEVRKKKKEQRKEAKKNGR